MGSKHKKLKSIGPLPRKLQPNDISLFESWGIAFFETLFILVYDNFILKTRVLRTLYQGSGIGGVGGGIPPPGRKNFEYTPPENFGKIYPPPLGGAKRRRHFFGQNSKINVNLTGFSLNLVKLTLI